MNKGLLLLSVILLCFSCGDNPLRREWSIPVEDISTGLNADDDIPSIDSPEFIDIADVDFLEENDEVILVKVGNQIKVYPLKILEWHEMVNDSIAGIQIAVSHSTLSGTTSIWNRSIEGSVLTFGVSRYQYKNNQISFDRETLNYWSQLLSRSVSGNRRDFELEIIPHIQIPWIAVVSQFSSAKVLSSNTGFSRDYDVFPYDDYKTNNAYYIYDPIELDTTLESKDLVLGINSNDLKTFYAWDYSNVQSNIQHSTFDGKDLIIFSNSQLKLHQIFLDPKDRNFEVNFTNPLMFGDDLGNTYNLLGEIIEGPNTGEKLSLQESKRMYWFVWADHSF